MKLPKELSLHEIAALCGGRVARGGDTRVKAVAVDPMSAGEGELALVFDPKLARRISECRAEAVVVPPDVKTDLPSVVVERPLLALARMLKAVSPRRFLPEPGVHPAAVVDPTCELGADVAIGPMVVIGPHTKIGRGTTIMAGCIIGGAVTIGEDCHLHPGCLVADYVQIGDRVILQQGASLGSDGFGYVTERPSNMERRLAGIAELSREPNPLVKIPQIGTVVLEDDVEIGSNATIARATMGATTIGKGSKIDNLVMVAHNARVGREVIVVSLSGIAGSCVLGDRSIIAGHVGIKDHLKVGADSIVEGMAGVMRDVPEGEVVTGIPAVNAREHFTNLAHVRKLPRLADELKALKKKVAELEALVQQRPLVSSGDHADN